MLDPGHDVQDEHGLIYEALPQPALGQMLGFIDFGAEEWRPTTPASGPAAT